MALSRAAVHLLVREAARRPFHGTVVTLGRQHVYVTLQELQALADQYRVPLKAVVPRWHRDDKLAAAGYLSDDSLFELLGFERSVRVDYSDYEAAEHVFDLNNPTLPNELVQQFDLVLDSGTIEHIFDIATALMHCGRMVKSGGRIIHLTPSSNCVEHGFYSVSPTLFADFYSASEFTLETILLCSIPLDLLRGVWRVYDYLRSAGRFMPLGMLSGRTWFTFCVVTSSEQSHVRVPQQTFYASAWDVSAGSSDASSSDVSEFHAPAGSRAASVLSIVSGSRALTWLVQRGISFWRTAINGWRMRRGVPPYPFVGQF